MNITLEWLTSQPFEMVGNNKECIYKCPDCDTKHLYVNIEKTLWYCFKCGIGGRVQTTNNTMPDLSTFKDKEKPWFENKVLSDIVDKVSIKSLPLNIKLKHISGYSETIEEFGARAYLYSRGIKQDEIDTYDIRLSIERSGPCKKSIVFPIYAKDSNVLDYFVCRKYDKSEPKYINAPWPKNDTLFIADANKGGPNYPWVICEGIFDALAVCRVEYNAIALLGKTATSQQLKRLLEKEQYLIYLDEDAFSKAINLKLQLNAVGTKAKLVVHKLDAAQLYLDNTPLLRTLLDGSTKQLNEYKR